MSFSNFLDETNFSYATILKCFTAQIKLPFCNSFLIPAFQNLHNDTFTTNPSFPIERLYRVSYCVLYGV